MLSIRNEEGSSEVDKLNMTRSIPDIAVAQIRYTRPTSSILSTSWASHITTPEVHAVEEPTPAEAEGARPEGVETCQTPATIVGDPIPP